MPRLPSFWRKRGTISSKADIPTELTEFPLMSVGAPDPLMLSNDYRLALAYHVDLEPRSPTGYATISRRDPDAPSPIILVTFDRYVAVRHYSFNDEGRFGHKLYRQLTSYAVCEVLKPSWAEAVDRVDRAHPRYIPGMRDGLRHIVFTFQDSTLEVLCRGFSFQVHATTMAALLPQMQAFVNGV